MQPLLHRPLLQGIIIALLCGTSGFASSEQAELDITITLMRPGETPQGFINRLELPPATDLNELKATGDRDEVLDTVTSDLEALNSDLQQTINTTITDAISVGDLGTLPDSVIEILTDDLTGDVTDNLPNELVEDLTDDTTSPSLDATELSQLLTDLREALIRDAVTDQLTGEVANDLPEELPDELIDQLVNDLVEELGDSDNAIPDSAEVTQLINELRELLDEEGVAIEAQTVEQILGDNVDPEVIEELLRQIQSDDLESLDEDSLLDAIDQIEDEGTALPDPDVIDTGVIDAL